MIPFENPVASGAFWGAAFGSLMFLLLNEVVKRITLGLTQTALLYGEMKALERREQELHQATAQVEMQVSRGRRPGKKERWRRRRRRR